MSYGHIERIWYDLLDWARGMGWVIAVTSDKNELIFDKGFSGQSLQKNRENEVWNAWVHDLEFVLWSIFQGKVLVQ